MNFPFNFNPEMAVGAFPGMQPPAQQAQQPQGLEGMSPDQFGAAMSPVLDRNTLGTKREDLMRQMEMANALRRGSGQQYKTGLGAALGGIGDIAGQVYGGYKMGQTEEGLQANTEAMRDPSFYKSPIAQALFMAEMQGKANGSNGNR
jgi:hypothetical protein